MKKYTLKVLSILLAIPIFFSGCIPKQPAQPPPEQSPEKEEATVTAEEIQRYREITGSDFDTKKAVIILFNTQEQCAEFIEQYGEHQNVLDLGIGTVPEMSEDKDGKFFNVTGNSVLEPSYDAIEDGEYCQQPVEYAGMWCYLKRLKTYNVLDDEQSAKEFIGALKKMQGE